MKFGETIFFMNFRRHSLLLFLFIASRATTQGQQLAACNCGPDANKKVLWGFCDRFISSTVIKCQYDTTMAFTEGLGRVRQNGKYGFVDKTGKLVIPAKFDAADAFAEGFAAVFADGKSFFIDKKGVDVFKKTFKAVSGFNNGLAMCSNDEGKRGFIDTKGNAVIPLALEAAHPFNGGLAPVRFNGEKIWKAINTKGEAVFTFSDKVKSVMGSFNDGMAMVYVDGPAGYNVHYDFVNEKGDFVCDAPYASAKPFQNGRAIITYENKNRKSGDLQYFKYGLIKKGGREIVRAQYACLEESLIPGIYYYGSTSSSISNCSGYGLLDSNGKELTQPKYSRFTRVNDTTFLCKEAGKYESLNKYLLLTTQGKELLSLNHSKYYFTVAGPDTLLVLYTETANAFPITVYHLQKGLLKENAFQGIEIFEKQRLLLIENWEHAAGTLMTTDGKVIMDKIQTNTFRRDTTIKADIPFILVSTDVNKDFKMFNLNTRKIMVNEYGFKKEGNPYYSTEFTEGLLPVRQKNKWGYIDTAGKIKLPAIYESAENFHEGLAVVGKKGKGEFADSYEVYINKAGKELPAIKASYLNASKFSEGFAFYKKEGFSETVRYINKTGKEIFISESDKYYEHGDFSNGLAAVPNKEGKYGYINTKGELVIPYQYSISKTQYSSVRSIAFNNNGFAYVVKDGKNITISKP
jgi:WG containing repeat